MSATRPDEGRGDSPRTRPDEQRAQFQAVGLDPGTGGPAPSQPTDPFDGSQASGDVSERECTQWRVWEEWRTAADERVCPECAPLHGAWFVKFSGPQPPLHGNCRCTRVEVWWECVSRAPAGGGGAAGSQR